jgi:hypothetical protein
MWKIDRLQRNAHITESREVLYRWHPWHGRAVFIFSAISKGEYPVFRCALDPADVSRLLEVPQWMFDATTCCHIKFSATPKVSLEALRGLDKLLAAVRVPNISGVLQAQHHSLSAPGDAGETHEGSTPAQSTDAVSATAHTAVDEFSARDSQAHTKSAHAVSTCTPSRSARRDRGVR